jgi:hypothetical protein
MASQFVNTYRGKTGILSKYLPHTSNTLQNLRDIYYFTIADVQKLSTSHAELTQLQHPWYLSDFAQYEYIILCK